MADQLVQNLPTPFREDQATKDFLQAFEKVLLGVDDGVSIVWDASRPNPYRMGLEELIALLPTYFDPMQAPEEFLPWLAGWLAFALRADLPQTKHRAFIRELTSLYRWRGTQQNLRSIFFIFTNREPAITLLEADPLCFRVMVDLSDLVAGRQQAEVDRQIEIAHALIRREKPAHTRYILLPIFDSFRLGGVRTDGTQTPFNAQVGGEVNGQLVGNTRLGVARWDS